MVQVEPHETHAGGFQIVEGVKILWDEEIEIMSRRYGSIIIDFLKIFVNERFIVSFNRSQC